MNWTNDPPRHSLVLAILVAMGLAVAFFVGQVVGYLLVDVLLPNAHTGTALLYATLLTAIWVMGGIFFMTRHYLFYQMTFKNDLKFQKNWRVYLLGIGLWFIYFCSMQSLLKNHPNDPLDFLNPLMTDSNKIGFIILMVFIAPIYEELLFRGIMLNTLLYHKNLFKNKNLNKNHHNFLIQNPQNPIFASIIVSLLFSIAHLQYDFLGILLIFLFSLLLCFLKIHTNGLYLPIFVHFINNMVAMMIYFNGN